MKHLFMLKKCYLLLLVCMASMSSIFGQNLNMASKETCTSTVELTATAPSSSTHGQWSRIDGGVEFIDYTSYKTTAYVNIGVNVLRWTLYNANNVQVDYGDITVTRPEVTTANAGTDLTSCSSFTLGANSPTSGTGQWSIISGTGTFVNVNNPNSVISGVSGGTTILRWTITSGSCISYDEVVLNSSVAVPVLNKTELLVCPGSFAQVQVTGGDSYRWTAHTKALPYLNGITSNSPTISYSTLSSADYTVYAKTTACPKDSVSATVTAYFSSNAVKANAGEDINFCRGSNGMVMLQAQGKGTFEWSPSSEMTEPTSANPRVYPSVTTTYLLKFTDVYGCTATDAVTVNVITGDSPTASISAEKTSICQGESVDLVASGGTSYQWASNSTLSNRNVYNPIVTPQESETYYVTVTNKSGCTDTQSIIIYVDPSFNIYKNNDVSTAGGKDGSLYVALELRTFSVLWSTGETTQSISSLAAGHYTATVSNSATGCQLEKSIEVLEPTTNPCTLKADFTTELEGNTLYVYNQSVGGTKFTWNFGDGSVDYSDNVATHSFSSEGSYQVELTAYESNTCISKLSKTVSIGTSNCKAEIGYTQNASNPKEVHFIANTSKNIKTWYWEFGDGSVSDAQNPVHTYADDNRYSVALRVKTSISGCIANDIEIINVGTDNLKAAFVPFVDVTSISGNTLTVSFSDMSLGTVSNWYWNFGDGSSSTERNPVHSYTTNKTYIVTLTIQNAKGKLSNYTLPVQTGTSQISAKFDFSVDALTQTVSFVNKSTGQGLLSPCLWLFDDGSISILNSPSHNYKKAGLYKVSLIVSDLNNLKFDRITKEVQIGTINCSAKFAAFVNPTSHLVKFENEGIGSNLLYNWEFGDNTLVDQANPTHSYNKEAYYTVRLRVRSTDNTCMDSYQTTILVSNQGDYNKADFAFRSADKTSKFINLTKGKAQKYVWNFGDGSTSEEESPAHAFTSYGNFNVCLTAYQNKNSYHSLCQTIRIVPESNASDYVQADFESMVTIAEKTVHFFDKSKGTATKWDWNFGDGKTSLEQSPTNSYATAGYYLVRLTATNGNSGLKNTVYKLINVGAENKLALRFIYAITPTSKKAGGYPLDLTGAAFGDPAKMVWEFGDGTSDTTTTTPNHVYQSAGIYNVCVTATDPITSQQVKTCEKVTVLDTDIEELKKESNTFALTVAPNPANDFVSITYTLNETSSVNLSLFDVTGKKLVCLQNAKVEKGLQELKIDISQLTQGMYYLHLQSGNQVSTKKLIINR